jgi:tetratricopeptide (TPR) repeat protein
MADVTAQDSPIGRRYGKAGEASWSHVLNHFALNEGFALIVLVVPDQDASDICCRELAGWLGARGKRLLDLSPGNAGALHGLASTLLAQTPASDLGCVWLGAATAESDADQFVWRDAWRWGLGTLNQHRNTLQEHFDCAVVIAGPPWLLPLFREVAPDLWSVRSIVAWLETDFDVSVPVFPLESERWEVPLELIGQRPAGDLNLALREVDRLREVPGKELRLAELLLRAGHGYESSGFYAQAEAMLREARDIFKSTGGHASDFIALRLLATVITNQKRPDEAELLLREALLLIDREGYSAVRRVAVLVEMATAIVAQGRLGETEGLLKDALSHDLDVDDAISLRGALFGLLARVVGHQGRYTEAEGLFRQALSMEEQTGAGAISRAGTIGRLGHMVMHQHKFEDAEALFRQELMLRQESEDDLHSQINTMVSLGQAILRQGRLQQARAVFAQALELEEKSGASPEVTKKLRLLLARLQSLPDELGSVISKPNTDADAISAPP